MALVVPVPANKQYIVQYPYKHLWVLNNTYVPRLQSFLSQKLAEFPGETGTITVDYEPSSFFINILSMPLQIQIQHKHSDTSYMFVIKEIPTQVPPSYNQFINYLPRQQLKINRYKQYIKRVLEDFLNALPEEEPANGVARQLNFAGGRRAQRKTRKRAPKQKTRRNTALRRLLLSSVR